MVILFTTRGGLLRYVRLLRAAVRGTPLLSVPLCALTPSEATACPTDAAALDVQTWLGTGSLRRTPDSWLRTASPHVLELVQARLCQVSAIGLVGAMESPCGQQWLRRLDWLLRKMRGSDAPFAGVQLLLTWPWGRELSECFDVAYDWAPAPEREGEAGPIVPDMDRTFESAVEATAYNQHQLSRCSGDFVQFERDASDPGLFTGVPERVVLARGARVFLLTPSAGFPAGSHGTVLDWHADAVRVRFDAARERPAWIAVASWHVRRDVGSELSACRQVPLALAWGRRASTPPDPRSTDE